MWYSTRPPVRRSCEVTVAGYVGGPHQRSSWRGSAQSCHTRAGGTSNAASRVMVRCSGSLRTAVTVIGLFLRVLDDERGHAADPPAPQLLVLIEQAARHAQPLEVGP